MPATIRSSPDFAAGNLVLTAHAVKTQINGLVEAKFQFACLATSIILQRNLLLFSPEAIPPVTLPLDVAAMPLKNGNVFLVDYSNTIEKGVAYIEANYVGISMTSKGQYSESSTTKTASATVSYQKESTFGLSQQLGARASFDYTAVAVTIQHCSFNILDRKNPKARAENIRNYGNSAGFTSTASTGGFTNITLIPPQEDIISVSVEKVGPVYVITESAAPEFVDMTLNATGVAQ